MTGDGPDTAVARARAEWGGAYGGLTPPLVASDTYRWADADTEPAYDYSRTVNPNRDMLAELLAELEGAAGGVVTGSGQSAALLALLPLPAGALVVAPHDCYGGTHRLLAGFAERGRIRVDFVDLGEDRAFGAALAREPALVWFETPSNPLLRLTDLQRRAGEAKAAGALTLADNTLMTPILQRPIALGCDMVVHSTTKALNGHADLFGGGPARRRRRAAGAASLVVERHRPQRSGLRCLADLARAAHPAAPRPPDAGECRRGGRVAHDA